MLVLLVFLLCPDTLWPDALPVLEWPLLPLPFGVEVAFHVMFDGVVGREPDTDKGWNTGPESGETGRRRPRPDMSVVSDAGGVSFPLPLRSRSSGVKRPLVVRLKNIGETDVGVDPVGDIGLDGRVVEALEFERYMLEAKVCAIGGG